MKTSAAIFNIANVSLIFMTILQIIMPIMVRFAHKRADQIYGTKFHSTSAVCLTEATKMGLCFVILCCIYSNPSKLYKAFYNGFVVHKFESLKMCVPAVIYFAQTNLYYFALSKLNAAVFTVTYQLRILTIAIMAAIILKKVFTLTQWGALLICLAGVICVNSSKFNGSNSSKFDASNSSIFDGSNSSIFDGSNSSIFDGSNSSIFDGSNSTIFDDSNSTKFDSTGYFDPENMDQLIGIGLVLAMCWMSAFAGVYLEKVLKDSPDDLWLQNIRLSSVTLLITVGYISQRYITVENYDFFQGWNYWNWIVSFATAIGGLITAAVLKYADNVRKSLCQSLAICGTAFLSIALKDSSFTIGLSLGTVLVIISIFVYTFGGKKPEPKEKVVEDVEKNSNSSPNDKEISKNSLSLENPKETETEPMLKEVEVIKNVQEGA